MKNVSAKMLETLKQLKDRQTTSFGYMPSQAYNPPIRLNAGTIKALIARGLLEQHGEMPWNTLTDTDGRQLGHCVPLYRLSSSGLALIGASRKADEFPLEDGGPKIYTDLAEAEAAMERGETVRIECEPFPVDPYLIQLALDLQAKQKLEEWRQAQEPSPVPEENKPQHPFTFIAHLLTLAFDALHETQESTTVTLELDPWFCSIIIGRACVCLVKYYRDSDWEVSNTCF